MGEPLSINGTVVGVTAERRAEEQAELLRRRGATVVFGRTVQTRAVPDDADLRAITESVIASPPGYGVVITGAGFRSWLHASEAWGLDQRLVGALGSVRLVARGAKARSAIRRAGLREWWSAPRETVAEIRERLVTEPLDGARIVVTLHGADVEGLRSALVDAGAAVLEVATYRWSLPDDLQPAERLVRDASEGRLRAVTFTSVPAVSNLFAIAERIGAGGALRDAFNGPVVACCIGSVCADAATEEGIRDPLQPGRPRLVAMVDALAAHLVSAARS